MPPKRSSTASSSSPRKKAKTVDIPNQRNLHSFFAPPAAASAKASPKMQLGLDKFLKSVSSTTSKKKLKEVEVYNVDEEEGEALARRIAEEEGVDVEASKVLEMEWNSATLVQEAIASTSGSNAAGTSRIPTRKSSAPRVDDIPVPSPLEGKGKAAAEVYDVGARECEDDEAFARRLAEEGDILAVQSVQSLEMTWNIQQGGLASHSKSNLASTSQAAVLSDDGVDPSSSRTSTRSMSLSASPSKRAPGQVTLSSSDGPISYPSLTVDPLDFKLDSPWKEGQPAPYSFLVHALTTLSETRSRIIMLNTLTNALRTLILYHPPSLLPSVYILSNTLSPPYVPTELNIGPSILSKAIQSVSGQTPAALRALYHQFGDPGDVAFAAKSAVRTLIPHAPLTIKGVYASLVAISSAKGQGAAKQKQSLVEKLLVSAKGEEVRYLVRTLSQHLRVGAVRTTILTALARATVLTSPPPPCPRPPADSPYIAHTELMDSVRPLGESPKKKASPDPAREEIIARMAKADALMRRIYAQHPNHDHIVKAVLEAGLDGLSERIPLAVGIPILPTLGSPMRSLDEVYDRLGGLPFAAEFKYDGQRAQIHTSRDQKGVIRVKIFSRHLEDMTDKYPDIVFLLESIFESSEGDLQSLILDGEVVAVDPQSGEIKSFQELSNRARKDVLLKDVKVAVCLYVFDLMFLNNESLLQESFRERRRLIRERLKPVVSEGPGGARLDHVESCESEDGREAVEQFWQKAVESRCEGLMIKLLDSGEVPDEDKKGKARKKPLPATYEPDKRTSAWLKLKKDYVLSIGDSLDLIPIGAWHGNGRKARWWSPVLLAVWDDDAGKPVALCKCMSGFTDAFYKALSERYPENSDTCSTLPLGDYETGGFKPSVYFKPTEVWEIRGADITLSPVSTAALGKIARAPSKGVSLRFPRFMKIREDKGLEDASRPEMLADMYERQEGGKMGETGGIDDGELIDVDFEDEQDEEEDEQSGQE